MAGESTTNSSLKSSGLPTQQLLGGDATWPYATRIATRKVRCRKRNVAHRRSYVTCHLCESVLRHAVNVLTVPTTAARSLLYLTILNRSRRSGYSRKSGPIQ